MKISGGKRGHQWVEVVESSRVVERLQVACGFALCFSGALAHIYKDSLLGAKIRPENGQHLCRGV